MVRTNVLTITTLGRANMFRENAIRAAAVKSDMTNNLKKGKEKEKKQFKKHQFVEDNQFFQCPNVCGPVFACS